MIKWLEDKKRKEAAIKKIYDKMFAKAKGRFVIKCEGKDEYSLYDNNKQQFVIDWKWASWGSHIYKYVDYKSNSFYPESYKDAQQTADHIIWAEAMERFNNLIDHHHRIKNKEVSYT